MEELNAKVAALESREELKADDRLSFFSKVMYSTGKHSVASNQIRNSAVYGGRCAFCGSNNNITIAHLVAGNNYVDYSPFNVGYSSPLDVKSSRNFLPLCGTLGAYGTCHDEFDKFRITLLYSPFDSKYQIFCLDLVNSPKSHLHLQFINVDPSFPPYRRILAWRARKCLLEYGGKMADKGELLFQRAKFSDQSKSVASDDDDIETENVSEDEVKDSTASLKSSI